MTAPVSATTIVMAVAKLPSMANLISFRPAVSQPLPQPPPLRGEGAKTGFLPSPS